MHNMYSKNTEEASGEYSASSSGSRRRLGALQTNHNSVIGVKQASRTSILGDYNRSSLLKSNHIYRDNDYDDYSSGGGEPRTPMQFWYPAPPYTDAQAPVKVYKPREDPRLYYQSDQYLKEVLGKNINPEVTNIYPGREVVRMNEPHVVRPLPVRRLRSRHDNRIDYAEYKHCIKCPRDRTVVAKAGFDRVILQAPRLLSCSGRRAPKNIRFQHYFGPKFGTLLEEGSYSVVGRIVNRNEKLQMCKFKVRVVVQTCKTPESLITNCNGLNQPCNFRCRDDKMELIGATSLICGDDLQWDDALPTCRVRNWCITPTPPEHGRISCTGHQAGKSHEGLAEGSRCRVRCDRGWQSNLRIVAFCRRGNWTRALECDSNNSTQR
ncbi:hypothetical protein RR48_10280 [Papilio machaon]|uniref:Sushi domain-containing protein n=1 Tax=Papilio machaon TaxID=76193 RepID=A0A194RL25_PAPMA|nr:hypothetical protein RR48_10280 [Papilio machaon]